MTNFNYFFFYETLQIKNISFFYILFSICICIILLLFLLFNLINRFNLKFLNYFLINYKIIIYLIVTFFSVSIGFFYCFLNILSSLHLSIENINQNSIVLLNNNIYYDFFDELFGIKSNIYIYLNSYNLSFLFLFSFLYPIIF